jgi:ABC-2 type transport system permease protein
MWGSYLGLLFLGAGFVSIGIFASSLSENQIVSFILGVFMSFLMYFGIEQVSNFEFLGTIQSFIVDLGMFEHYLSVSRGVLDTRDLVYFGTLVAFFLMLTKLKLESRNW